MVPSQDKALRGVFLGDEICCMNATCWDTALKPVTEKLRKLLGKEALIYTNEVRRSLLLTQMLSHVCAADSTTNDCLLRFNALD